MCQHPNAVMLRFMMLINGDPLTENDRLLLKGHVDMLVEQAVRRGRYELAVMLELNDERYSSARYAAERHEDQLSLEAKIRLFKAFRAIDDDVARLLQHRWKLSKHLPKAYHR